MVFAGQDTINPVTKEAAPLLAAPDPLLPNGITLVSPDGSLALALDGNGNLNATAGIFKKRVTVSAAQIIAMNGAPVSVLTAVPGKAYVIHAVKYNFKHGGSLFTGGGATVLQYHTSANAVVNTLAAGVIQSGSDSYTVRKGIDATAAVNDGIDITNGTGAFAAGTGTLQIDFYYSLD